MKTAQSVYTAAGRRRRRAQIKTIFGRGIHSHGRTQKHLRQILNAARDVATDEVWIVKFEIGGAHDTARENTVAKSGRESFNLPFYGVAHVDGGSVGDMAIRPECVLTRGCAGGVKQRRLRDERERLFRVAAVRRVPFRFEDLRERSAEVNGRRRFAFRSLPRNGCAQRPIQFERGWTIAIALQAPAKARC